MYVCISIHICILVIIPQLFAPLSLPLLNRHTHSHTCTHTHIHTYTHTRIHTYTRMNVLLRGRPASAKLNYRITAGIVRKSLGNDGVAQLYMAVAMGLGKTRASRSNHEPFFGAWLQANEFVTRLGLLQKKRRVGQGLVRDTRHLLTFSVDAKELTKLNHMVS